MLSINYDFGTPNEKQKLFLQAKVFRIAFGGARGGGKSWAVRTKAKVLALRYPGIKICIVRKTYPELTGNHIDPLCQELDVYGEGKKVARYNDSKKIMKFFNGSTIAFKYCDSQKDVDRFQGLEYDVLFIDEAGQFTEEQLVKMTACVRGANDLPKRIYYTMNPGGVGHAYLKRVFIDRRYKDEEDPDEYLFIQSLVTDNAALLEKDPRYLRQLQALPPKLRRAWLEGDWDVYEGQFFEEFRDNPDGYITRQWTHVIEPFEIPEHWPVFHSYDYGYAKPFSCGWWAVDTNGRAYRIAELYGCTSTPNEGVKWTADKQFAEIKRMEMEHPLLKGKDIHGVADPAIFAADGGVSVAETAMQHQVYFVPGDNSRIPGWMQMHYRMAFDENGYPMMYVFNTCRAFIRTIPLMTYSETRMEDLDTTLEDHVADESRYFLMSRPIPPRELATPKQVQDDPLNLQPKHMQGVSIYKNHL